MRRLWRFLTDPSSAVLIGAIGGNALRMLSTILLTRALVPSVFGATAILGSVFFTISLLTDLGFEAYVVRHRRGDDRLFLDAIWTVHALRGGINFVIAALLSAPIAALLGKPELGPVLAVASVTLAINGLVSFGQFTAVRGSRLARITIFELGMAVVQTALSIAFALLTRDVWGFVAAMILVSIVRTVASYPAFGSSLPKPRYDRALVGDLWTFSRPIFLSSIVTLILGQTDKLILARSFTLAEFGIYGIAANIAAAPQAFAYNYANKVFYARLGAAERAEAGAAARDFYRRSWAFWLYLAGGGFLIGAAPVVIEVLYDPRYYEAGRYLAILSIASVMLAVTQCAANYFVVMGTSRDVLSMNVSRLVWLAAIAPLAFWLEGALGLVVVLGLLELPAYAFCLWRLRQLRTLSVRGEAIFWAIVAGGVAAGGVTALAAARLLPHL